MDLHYRWAVPCFGGTVRYTFEADEETVTLQITNVPTALFSVHWNTLKTFGAALLSRADPNTVLHRLMHCEVKKMRGVFDQQWKPASNNGMVNWPLDVQSEVLVWGFSFWIQGRFRKKRFFIKYVYYS